MRAIRELSAAGVPVRVMLAPIIPGVTDLEIPALLTAAKEAGACGAGYVMLRLPLNVAPIFMNWLQTHRPLAAPKVEALIRDVRGGRLNDSRWGSRMRGEGAYAEGIDKTFDLFSAKLGLDGPGPELNSSQFHPPALDPAQMRLFD